MPTVQSGYVNHFSPFVQQLVHSICYPSHQSEFGPLSGGYLPYPSSYQGSALFPVAFRLTAFAWSDLLHSLGKSAFLTVRLVFKKRPPIELTSFRMGCLVSPGRLRASLYPGGGDDSDRLPDFGFPIPHFFRLSSFSEVAVDEAYVSSFNCPYLPSSRPSWVRSYPPLRLSTLLHTPHPERQGACGK